MNKNIKTIKCRVCGKDFEPCDYCQNHNETFRWRNFACSIECAKKYIAETIAYREKQKLVADNENKITADEVVVSDETKNKGKKKTSNKSVKTDNDK